METIRLSGYEDGGQHQGDATGGAEEALGPGEPHEEHLARGGGDDQVCDQARQGELHSGGEGEIQKPSKYRKVSRPGLEGGGGEVQHCEDSQLVDEGARAAGRAVQIIPRQMQQCTIVFLVSICSLRVR